jgi:hypothetical protein
MDVAQLICKLLLAPITDSLECRLTPSLVAYQHKFEDEHVLPHTITLVINLDRNADI